MNPIVSRTQITLRSVQSTKSMSCKIEKEDYWSIFKSTKTGGGLDKVGLSHGY